jgi:hypothetical protein
MTAQLSKTVSKTESKPQSEPHYWIQKQLYRLQLGLVLQRTAEWMAGFLIALGTIVLICKLAYPILWPGILWLSLAAIPLMIWVGLNAVKNGFRESDAVSLLDQQLQSRGLLMTLQETQDPQWKSKLQYSEQEWRDNLVQIQPKRFFSFLTIPLVFAVAACLIPARVIQSSMITKPAVSTHVAEELNNLMQQLEEAKALDPQEKADLQKQIDEISKDIQNRPLTHEDWETVDALKQKMMLQMEEQNRTLEKAMATTSALSEDAALKNQSSKPVSGSPHSENEQPGDKASEEQAGLTEKEISDLEQTLDETLSQLNEKGGLENMSGKHSDSLKKKLSKAKKANLSKDPQEREEALDELEDFLKKECEKCEACKKKCAGMCEGECEGLGFDDEMKLSNSEKPGRGGVSRGRADAKLTFGDESDEDGTKFKEIVLPPGYLEDPKSEIIDVTIAAPQEEKDAPATRNSARTNSGPLGQETWNQQLHPRHKSVVKQFFEESQPKPSK